jgi:hypothetical protein
MTSARASLMEMLRGAIAGDEVTNARLYSAIPDPLALDRLELAAWRRLSHWADDEDIRRKDASYGSMQLAHLEDALADLEALEAGYIADEIIRGDHRGWHIPVAACLIVAVILALLAYFVIANGFFMGDP